MCAVAEIERIVTRSRGGKVRPRDHGLRFQRLRWSARRHLSRYHRRHGDFPIHRNHRDQFVIARLNRQSAVELPLDFAWNAYPEIGVRTIERRNSHGTRNLRQRNASGLAAFQNDSGVIARDQ